MSEQDSHTDGRRIERLAADLVEQAHVSIWAADRNFRIVLWNSGAEQIYGIERSKALGKNYLELFVDEYEQEESRVGCLRIINNGFRQHNCLAYDHHGSGPRRYMLTNCFRISDPETGEAYQAEIGVEISDLGLKDTEHRTLREVGIQRRTIERQTIEQRREQILTRVESLRSEVMKQYLVLKSELDSWRASAHSPEAKDAILPLCDTKTFEMNSAYKEDLKALETLRVDTQGCEALDGFEALQHRCDECVVQLKTFRGVAR